MQTPHNNSHSKTMGYILWIFGFTGAHRFYYGKKISGTIWFCTAGLFLIGWLIDIFLIPAMRRQAQRRYIQGAFDYDLAWILLVFLGFFGAHRFYLRKYWTGLLYLFTGGLLTVGWLYDLYTINEQIDQLNT